MKPLYKLHAAKSHSVALTESGYSTLLAFKLHLDVEKMPQRTMVKLKWATSWWNCTSKLQWILYRC